MRKKLLWFLFDSFVFLFSFYLLVVFKYGHLDLSFRTVLICGYSFIIWSVISTFTGKSKVVNETRPKELLGDLAISNFLILGSLLVLIRLRPSFLDLRFFLLYVVLLASVVEMTAGWLITYFNRVKYRPFEIEPEEGEDPFDRSRKTSKAPPRPVFTRESPEQLQRERDTLARILIDESDKRVVELVEKFIPAGLNNASIVSTTTRFNILNLRLPSYEVIINLKRSNDIQYLNKFFEAVNAKLNLGGKYIAWVETSILRKKRILAMHPWGINYLAYTLDFIVERALPKLPFTKKLYFFLTRGYNRVLSKAETYGRLYSCGFEIVEETLIGDRLFFVVRKIKEPAFDEHPTYGPLIRLKRSGKDGKIISVYKLRTMHAYSEYLQAYIYDLNKLQAGGKFKDDFRVTTLGKFFRKLWIDELPMVINLLKGDLKIVGVRPLSKHYFSLYSDELKEKRTRHKPGLVPPFYADMPETLDEIMASEMKYLSAYERHPLITDFRYFWMAVWNIGFKRARSK
jgi:lipopolysaccharide/colanic/teichoic acid biosynthesis glycosyltransferase